MASHWWPRLGAISGLVFAVLIVVADFVLVPGAPPRISDSDQSIAAFVAAHTAGLRWQGALEAIATGFLLCFVVYLSGLIRQREGAVGGLGWLALVGGTAVATLNWAWCMSAALLGYSAAGQAPTHSIYDLYQLLIAILQFPGAVFFGSVAAAALALGVLPRWLGWGAALVAVVQLIAAIVKLVTTSGQNVGGLIGFLLLILWFIAASVTLARQGGSVPGPAAPAP